MKLQSPPRSAVSDAPIEPLSKDVQPAGAETALVRRGRIAAWLVIALAGLTWTGWAIDVSILTRINPEWPPMTPWTALWLAALAVAILLQSGSPSPGRTRAGRGVAAVVGTMTVVVLSEYLTAHSFGADQLWFRDSVAVLPSAWPGRPSPQTALATLFLSIAVVLPRTGRRWIGAIRTACLVASMAVAGLALVAYGFEATALVEADQSTGIALPTALALVFLGAAALSLRPVVWILTRSNQWALVRMAVLVGSFPLLVGVGLRALRALGFREGAGQAVATTLAAVIIGAVVLRLSRRERTYLEQLNRQNALIASSERNYRLLLESAGDVVCHLRAGRVVWVSPTAQTVLGIPAGDWVGQRLPDCFPTSDIPAGADMLDDIADGDEVAEQFRTVGVDGAEHWIELRARPFYDDDHRDGVSVTLRPIDNQVAAEQAVQAARERVAMADARYRRSVDNAAIGMCLITPDGHFEEVNPALCQLFGYDAETLTQKTWQELTAPDSLNADLDNVNAILEGRLESYRMVKQYIHANGHPIWGDLSVSCIRDENGNVERFLSQITDITEAVEATERNRVLNQQLKRQTRRMTAELHSAAQYMTTIMPSGLTGEVEASSRYLPSRALGGDCFDYIWIDDDHLLVYLIDISGHGIEPALLSVSVHNMLRSGSVPAETLTAPETAAAELNRLFQMDKQGDHYFTMWFGVYQASTRILRYMSAGAPPALAVNPGTGEAVATIELATDCPPIGMFEDTVFTAGTYLVPRGCQILIFSDGASEIELPDGKQLSLAGFKRLARRVAGSPNWSLDDLIAELHALTATDVFEDDCSLIQLSFSDRAAGSV